jgi:hypothetical protein
MSAKESQSKIAQYQEMNRELEETAKRQRLKIERLTEENKLLQKQVIMERRLRYAGRNLVVGVDKAILAQIEKLRGGQNSGSVARYGNAGYDTSSAENLLNTIRQADLASFYSQKKAPRPKKLIAYKTVRNTYFVPRHLVAIFFRAALRLRKATKGKS